LEEKTGSLPAVTKLQGEPPCSAAFLPPAGYTK